MSQVTGIKVVQSELSKMSYTVSQVTGILKVVHSESSNWYKGRTQRVTSSNAQTLTHLKMRLSKNLAKFPHFIC